MTGPALPGLSVFFPVHDEAENLEPLLAEWLAALPSVARRFEVTIVDDGSRDGTASLADRLAAGHPGVVRAVHHERNRGYGAAVRAGLATARLDWVFFTDGDRQFFPEDLARLAAALGTADAAVGYRVARADPAHRSANAALWALAVRLALGVRLRDVNCAFKLLRRSALEGLRFETDGGAISAEIMARLARRGCRIVEIPVRHRPRVAGVASGNRLRVVARALADLAALRVRLRRSPGFRDDCPVGRGPLEWTTD